MKTNLTTFLITIAASGLFATLASAQTPRYTVTDLGTMGGTFGSAYGINYEGRVAGASATCCSSGIPNASVLPVPVRAWPMMSCPLSPMGRARLWMGKGEVMPATSRAAQICSSTPRSRNVLVTSGEPVAGLSSAGGSATDEVSVVVS